MPRAVFVLTILNALLIGALLIVHSARDSRSTHDLGAEYLEEVGAFMVLTHAVVGDSPDRSIWATPIVDGSVPRTIIVQYTFLHQYTTEQLSVVRPPLHWAVVRIDLMHANEFVGLWAPHIQDILTKCWMSHERPQIYCSDSRAAQYAADYAMTDAWVRRADYEAESGDHDLFRSISVSCAMSHYVQWLGQRVNFQIDAFVAGTDAWGCGFPSTGKPAHPPEYP